MPKILFVRASFEIQTVDKSTLDRFKKAHDSPHIPKPVSLTQKPLKKRDILSAFDVMASFRGGFILLTQVWT